MALKIISGMVLPTTGDQSYGSVVIDLRTGELKSKEAGRFTNVSIFGSGEITGKPAVQLSLRHIVSSDDETSFNLNDALIIEEGVPVAVSVSWHAEPKKSKIIEISVLIIAETK